MVENTLTNTVYIRTTAQELWRALTDGDLSVQYVGARVESTWRPGEEIVYLTPDAPRQSGTGVFRHKATGIWKSPTAADAIRLGLSRAELRQRLEADAKLRDRWELLDSADNVYNRAILFPSHWYHSGLNYFGDCLENGRLYQAFFFRAVLAET